MRARWGHARKGATPLLDASFIMSETKAGMNDRIVKVDPQRR